MFINTKRLFFLALFICLAINSFLPITDPVEATYALSGKEMYEHSRWLTPTLFGMPWFDKPVLFYFLTAVSFQVFGVSAFAARVMPALFAAGSITMLYWFVNRHASRKEALLAAAVLGSSLQFLVLSKLIITDMVLFFFSSAALVLLYTGWREEERRLRWILGAYACAALAVLTKGPVGLILPGTIFLAFLIYKKDGRAIMRLFHPLGLLLFVAVAAPWYIVMTQEFGDKFLSTFFGLHNYLRATVSEHPEDNFILYYPLLFILSTLPWSVCALRALYDACRAVWKRTASDFTVLSLFWTGIYLVFYSMMATKYPTYTFPALFPAAILTAQYLARFEGKLHWQLRPTIVFLGILFAALTVMHSQGTERAMALLVIAVLFLMNWNRSVRQPVVAGAAFIILGFMLTAATSLNNLAHNRSGEALGMTMRQYNQAPIGIFQTYSTSAVFYGNANLIKLETHVDKGDNGNVWRNKYPTISESFADFFAKTAGMSPVLLITKENDKAALEKMIDPKDRDRFVIVVTKI